DNAELDEKWDRLIKVREEALKALENARNAKVIGSSLDAKVILKSSGEEYEFLVQNKDIWAMIFICSEVIIEQDSSISSIEASVVKADGEKCKRCWLYSTSVGEHHEHPALCNRCATVLEGVDVDKVAKD
ncbi:MAG TPA: zinc finger domain-containing protein, partial [Thermoclostridium sp.]|nr:zinc finger domain-containing protein [Thermoclostridium sp.]